MSQNLEELNLLERFKEYVKAIEKYTGSDPLQPWYEYLLWIEESFTIDFKKDTICDDILVSCLSKFENCHRYRQDRRLIKIFIKYIHFRAEGPHNFFKEMHKIGFGDKVSDLYVNWAFTYVINGDFDNAEKIYQLGTTAEPQPQPIDLLHSEHLNFRMTLSQIKDQNEILMDSQSVQRRLNILSALRFDGTNNSFLPKKCSLSMFNQQVLQKICLPNSQAHNDSVVEPTSPVANGNLNASIVQSIQNSARKRKPLSSRKVQAVACRLKFESSPLPAIPLEQNMFGLGIQLQRIPNFKNRNLPQEYAVSKPFKVSLDKEFIRKEYHYDKIMLCPADDKGFSTEELMAYKWFKKNCIINEFTKEHDKIWGCGYDVPLRYPKIFAQSNLPQDEWHVNRKGDEDNKESEVSKRKSTLSYNQDQHYPNNTKEEFSIEELMWQKRSIEIAYEQAKNGNGQIDVDALERSMRNPNVFAMLQKSINDKDIHSRSNLSPIYEETTGMVKRALADETNKLNPPKVEKRHLPSMYVTDFENQAVKRMSINANYLDGLNETCSTQMFSNMLKTDFVSTPNPIKTHNTQKLNENIEKVENRSNFDATKIKVFADETMRESAQMIEKPFSIFKEETFKMRETEEMAKQNVLSANQRNAMNTEKLVQDENAFLVNRQQQQQECVNTDLIKGENVDATLPNSSKKSYFSFDYENSENTAEFIFEETRAKYSPAPSPNIGLMSNLITDGCNPNATNPRNMHEANSPLSDYLRNFCMSPNSKSMLAKETNVNEEVEDFNETIGRSIYEKPPDLESNEKEAEWHEVTEFFATEPTANEYKIDEVDLNETRQKIDTYLLDFKNMNPFDVDFQIELLKQNGFFDIINGANNFNCKAVNIVSQLKTKSNIVINNHTFQIRKVIGSGSYGKVYLGECAQTKETLAFKQQRPPNLWEYYICLEVQTRIQNQIAKAFMSIDYALIGNNSTIYASTFSKYGTLLNVCNSVKKTTGKNGLDECIVMILAKQMISMFKYLHEAKIIHADVKPDNFLLMDKLDSNLENEKIVLQLIDFGQSIDLEQFPPNQMFFSKVDTQNFICTEMMNDKPWTYQFDLFCLASTIYTLLTGKYMDVSRQSKFESYKPQKLPRYVNTDFWNDIFDTLINISNPRKMPSLSNLEQKLSTELLSTNCKKIVSSIGTFNMALNL